MFSKIFLLCFFFLHIAHSTRFYNPVYDGNFGQYMGSLCNGSIPNSCTPPNSVCAKQYTTNVGEIWRCDCPMGFAQWGRSCSHLKTCTFKGENFEQTPGFGCPINSFCTQGYCMCSDYFFFVPEESPFCISFSSVRTAKYADFNSLNKSIVDLISSINQPETIQDIKLELVKLQNDAQQKYLAFNKTLTTLLRQTNGKRIVMATLPYHPHVSTWIMLFTVLCCGIFVFLLYLCLSFSALDNRVKGMSR